MAMLDSEYIHGDQEAPGYVAINPRDCMRRWRIRLEALQIYL